MKTTKELMRILGVTNKSALRIAAREKWKRLDNVGKGGHAYDVSDIQLKDFLGGKVHQSTQETRLKKQIESSEYLLGLMDRRICTVDF